MNVTPSKRRQETARSEALSEISKNPTFFALVLILVIIISIMAICARCKREQRGNQRSFEMTDRQSSYEPPVVVQGERVPTPMGRVPPSKLDSPRGAVV